MHFWSLIDILSHLFTYDSSVVIHAWPQVVPRGGAVGTIAPPPHHGFIACPNLFLSESSAAGVQNNLFLEWSTLHTVNTIFLTWTWHRYPLCKLGHLLHNKMTQLPVFFIAQQYDTTSCVPYCTTKWHNFHHHVLFLEYDSSISVTVGGGYSCAFKPV